MFKDLKIHLESVKLLEENMGWEATLIFCVRDDFIDATAKWWVTKIKIHDYDIKQSLFIAKEASHRREVSQLSEGHVGKPHVRGRIVLKNCRYSFFNSMFLNLYFLNGLKIWLDVSPEKMYKWPQVYEMFSVTSHQGNANQSHMRYHLTPARMATSKRKKKSSEYYQGCGKIWTMHTFGGNAKCCSLCRNSMRLPQNLNMEIQYDPAIPTPGIYGKNS